MKGEASKNKVKQMAEFETVSAEEIKYGKNNFIEIALKNAIDEEGNKNPFVSISKGWYPAPDVKKYKGGIGFPAEPEIIGKFIEVMEGLKT